MLDAYRSEHGIDLSDTYGPDSLAISHLETSLSYDVELLRKTPAVPATVKIFGMVFDIDRSEFTTQIPGASRQREHRTVLD